ncbi:MAG: hypothetical protein IT372_28655 [Polyangiaceae bacterium]|nr:hypothetical protein [Polyangiaceae bacterium]
MSNRLARVALLAALPWAIFAACAEGSDIESPGGTSGTGGSGGGSGIPPGQIGGPCEVQDDCVEGTCTQVGAGKYCTAPCPPACPTGTYCAIIEGDPICVPDLGQQCLQCNAPVDCKSPSDACLTAPAGDKFCATDCTTMGVCPNGFTCVEAAEYPNGGGAGGGAGGSDPDAGAGAGGPSGVPHKFCVPNSGASCPCSTKRDGVTHTCYKESPSGTCVGTETCNGETGNWEGCDAGTPASEICNAEDDNCDGQIDNGDPTDLCGASPPHATWACNAGTCQIGACDPGWTQFPTGPASAGCTCQQEPTEPNGDCSHATDAGDVSDSGGSLVLAGTLSSDQDVDFWTFDAIDTAQGNTNTYHVSIDFTSPAPNDEFQMDVIRGNACVAVPAGPGAGITSYDWCVDGNSADGTMGEAGCGPTSAVHCADHTSKYYVRVSRRAGAAGTCAGYSITITATGGDACDFTQQCQ